MKKRLYNKAIQIFVLVLGFSLILMNIPAFAVSDVPMATTVKEFTDALVNAKDGDTVLVGDITFKPMPMGMISVQKNVKIKSGKDTNAIFTNATFAFNGSVADSAPLSVQFENIDFRGDCFGKEINPASPPEISSKIPSIMKTMCAGIFKMNVNASYSNCTFEGYHYGYGGVFSAIYSSDDNKNMLNLSLDGCTFKNNAAKYGGSIYLSGYGHNINFDARHCIFEDNCATTGGAIWAEDANVHLLDCSLTGNRYIEEDVTEPNGGALALYNCGVDLDGCLIANNTSGGDGAGVYCSISPFKTLIMENCTVIGNEASADKGISVALEKTKLDTSAAAHIYFSSLFGEQNFSDNVELFGCLIVEKNIDEKEPTEENNYCLELTEETAREKGLVPDLAENAEHISVPQGEYTVPQEAIDKVAGGKFSQSMGILQVGDNYRKEETVQVKITPERTENVTVAYGEELTLPEPERKGFSFEKWESPLDADKTVFMGGELPETPIKAQWHFDFFDKLYVVWILIFAFALAIAFLIYQRRRKSTEAVPLAENGDNLPLSDDWINKVCESPEITALISKRELEVLHKLLEGKSRKQIAEELFITEATIRKHSTNIYSKLEVHNRTELVYKLTKH